MTPPRYDKHTKAYRREHNPSEKQGEFDGISSQNGGIYTLVSKQMQQEQRLTHQHGNTRSIYPCV